MQAAAQEKTFSAVNGALMRVAPLGVWAHRLPPQARGCRRLQLLAGCSAARLRWGGAIG